MRHTTTLKARLKDVHDAFVCVWSKGDAGFLLL